MFYSYQILFDDGCYYYGVRKSPCSNPEKDPYVGSPVTFKEKWKQEPFEKIILNVFDTWEEAIQAEIKLIEPVYKSDEKCLNRNCNKAVHPDLCKIGGSKKDSVKRKQDASKGGIKASVTNKINCTAIFGMSAEDRTKAGIKGGKTSGRNNVLNGHLDRIRSAAAAKQHAQRWMNTHPEHPTYVSTACGLSSWQRKRNIPTTYRRQLKDQ